MGDQYWVDDCNSLFPEAACSRGWERHNVSLDRGEINVIRALICVLVQAWGPIHSYTLL